MAAAGDFEMPPVMSRARSPATDDSPQAARNPHGTSPGTGIRGTDGADAGPMARLRSLSKGRREEPPAARAGAVAKSAHSSLQASHSLSPPRGLPAAHSARRGEPVHRADLAVQRGTKGLNIFWKVALGVFMSGVILPTSAGTLGFLGFAALHAAYVPEVIYKNSVYFQYPAPQPVLVRTAEIVPLTGEAVPSDWATRQLQVVEHTGGSACATISTEDLPSGRFMVNLDLVLSAPERGDVQPVMCSVNLLRPNRSMSASSSRPLVLATRHWAVQLWSAFLWGPFISMGVVHEPRHDVVVRLFDQLPLHTSLTEEHIHSAEICMRPALPVFSAEVHIYMHMTGVWQFVQAYPKACYIVVVGFMTFMGFSCGCVGTLWTLRDTVSIGSPRQLRRLERSL
eukprot:NODE_10115_length_1375_cov_10.401442.p1 GENE.NODE_10115_length_1375_cov_10.401442~~NODE_10115_length_1375_cov_10.401442.p1  ORF type:complete len:418 (-),score=88.34 NODE_10115_length_1375_cov_10.401442:120-1310(-)